MQMNGVCAAFRTPCAFIFLNLAEPRIMAAPPPG